MTSVVQAQVIPGRWEKVAALESGAQIFTTMKSGERIKGRFLALSTDTLMMAIHPRSELQILKKDILEITREYDDSNLDGTMWGLAAGAGAMFAVYTAWYYSNGNTNSPGIMLLPIGALIGHSLDKSRKGIEVLYRARLAATPDN
jgi:hypothetical protein